MLLQVNLTYKLLVNGCPEIICETLKRTAFSEISTKWMSPELWLCDLNGQFWL